MGNYLQITTINVPFKSKIYRESRFWIQWGLSNVGKDSIDLIQHLGI